MDDDASKDILRAEKAKQAMKLDVTEAQLRAKISMADNMEGMLGNGGDLDENGKEPDDYWRGYIRLVDRMLKKNGYSRR